MKLRITTILFSSLVLLGISSCSDYRVSPEQSEYFTKYYGGPGEDNGRTIRKTNDGGFIIAGTVTNTTLGHEQAYIAKLDSKGDLTWQRSLGDTTTFGTSVNLVSTGGYILCGYVMNSTDSDIVLYKFSNSGELVAETILSQANDQIANDVIEVESGANAGSFLVVGSNFVTSNMNFYFFGITSDLSTVFGPNDVAGDGIEDDIYNRVIRTDNGYLAIGTNSSSGGRIRLQILSENLNASGNGQIGIEEGKSVAIEGNTIFALGNKNISSNSQIVVYVGSITDVTIPPTQTFDIPSPLDETGTSVIIDGNELVISGTVKVSATNSNKLLIRMNKNTGEIISRNEYGGSEIETSENLIKDNNGGYVMIGNASSDQGNTVIEILKVKSNGTQTPD